MELILFLAATSLGGLVQSMTGIGYGIILMGFGSLVFPYLHVLGAIKILALLFIIPVLVRYRDKIRWKILYLPLLFTIPGNAIALRMLEVLDDRVLKIILGGILIVTGTYFLTVKKSFSIRPSIISGGIAGVIVGFLSGISSISGPALAMYYLNIDELSNDKNAYYATTLTTFQIAGLYQVSLLLLKGLFPIESWTLILWGFVPTSLGIFLGGKIFAWADIRMVKIGIYISMPIMGLFLILTSM